MAHRHPHPDANPFRLSLKYSIQNFFKPESLQKRLEPYSRPLNRQNTHNYHWHQLTEIPHSSEDEFFTDEHYSDVYCISRYILAFVLDTIPRLTYNVLLLGLPAHYYFRVQRVFQDADISIEEVERGFLELAAHRKSGCKHEKSKRPKYEHFEVMWKDFIRSLVKEWESLDVIAAIFLPADLTLLGMDAVPEGSLIHEMLWISMLFAFISIFYGFIYTNGFNGMLETYKAVEWVKEWEKSRIYSPILWNDWVFLAMPAICLAWSMIMFCICAILFAWDLGVEEGRKPVVPRFIFTVVVVFGLVYLVLIFLRFRRYGTKLEMHMWKTLQGLSCGRSCHHCTPIPQPQYLPMRHPDVVPVPVPVPVPYFHPVLPEQPPGAILHVW